MPTPVGGWGLYAVQACWGTYGGSAKPGSAAHTCSATSIANGTPMDSSPVKRRADEEDCDGQTKCASRDGKAQSPRDIGLQVDNDGRCTASQA